jgi:predicted TIM-barrel fold metal-dependent hydrolase
VTEVRRSAIVAAGIIILAIGAALPMAGHAGDGVRLAQAGPGRPPPEVMIRNMDGDGDGRISRAEFRGPPQVFPMMDSDGDGFLTLEELSHGPRRANGGPMKRPAAGPHADWYRRLPIILTHTHFNVLTARGREGWMDWDGAEANALKLMDANGIRAAIIMPTPGGSEQPPSDSRFLGLLRIAKRHPDRFRVSGGGDTLNRTVGNVAFDRVDAEDRRAFTARAEEIVSAGAVGFGELAALHFSFFEGHPFERRRPDHPLFRLLADVAARHDVPIDFHVEAVAHDRDMPSALRHFGGDNPGRIRENLAALDRLLSHNAAASIIWVHVGMDTTGDRTVALTRRMLRAHPNLYLSITSSQRAEGDGWFFVPGRGLNPAWRALMLEFPDRFMIGSDTFFQPEIVWHRFPTRLDLAIGVIRTAALPPAVARKVAFENAQRLFHLNFVRPEDFPLPAASPGAPTAGSELVGPRGLTARQVIARNNRNGDGKLARGEFRVPPQQFRALDADGDGFVTREELEARWRVLMAR